MTIDIRHFIRTNNKKTTRQQTLETRDISNIRNYDNYGLNKKPVF